MAHAGGEFPPGGGVRVNRPVGRVLTGLRACP